MLLGNHLKPKVDAQGRVRYVRDRMAWGLIVLILGLVFSYPLYCIVIDNGMPGITDEFTDAHDLLPWLFVLAAGGFAVAGLHLLIWRQTIVCDPQSKAITFVRMGLLGVRRCEVPYAEAMSQVAPMRISYPRGADWSGYGLFVQLPDSCMLISRAVDRGEVEQMAQTFSELTGLPRQDGEGRGRRVSFLDG